MNEWFVYQASYVEIVDGDTIDARVDLGFGIRRVIRLRLARVDTAEIFGVEKESEEFKTGKAQKAFVREWFQRHLDTDDPFPFVVITEQDETAKYGRYLAHIRAKGRGQTLNEAIIEEFPDTERAEA